MGKQKQQKKTQQKLSKAQNESRGALVTDGALWVRGISAILPRVFGDCSALVANKWLLKASEKNPRKMKRSRKKPFGAEEKFMLLLIVMQTIAMLLTAVILPGLKITSPIGALLMVIVLSVVNSTIWSNTLFGIIPDSLSLHVLAVIFANGVLFYVLVKLLPGIEIRGVVSAFLAPLIFTVLSGLIYTYGRDVDWKTLWSEATGAIEDVKTDLERNVPMETAPAQRPARTSSGEF